MDELEHRLTAVEKLAGSNRHRLDEVEKRQDNLENLVSTVSTLANELGHVKGDVAEIKGNVQRLIEKPGRRWDAVVDKLIGLILAALVGFGLGQIGL